MTDPTEITPGTVVKLKSGGPRMTVTYIDGESCCLMWFVDEHMHESDGMPLAALRVVPDGEAA